MELDKKIVERELRIGELKSIIEDLSELNYQPSEDKELRKEENRLTHYEKLTTILGQVRNQLHEKDGSVIEQLEILRKLLSEAQQIDPECAEINTGIDFSYISQKLKSASSGKLAYRIRIGFFETKREAGGMIYRLKKKFPKLKRMKRVRL